MAPYAITTNWERENADNVRHSPIQANRAASNNDVAPLAFTTNGPTDDTRAGGRNGNDGQPNGNATNNGVNGLSDSLDMPSPITSYENAYTDGYKDGYTSGYAKSYVKLKHQPIAIIGMSCRLPGSVSTPDEFWELLARSRTGFSEIPSSRFSADRFVHPNPGKSGTTNARGGNFLTHDLKVFDAPFFGFTQQEATSLDPQQRLLLECTFEALESAGVPKHEVLGKDVGVFVGGTFSEYEADLFRDPETIPMYQATGCAMAMQSNRISHFFDFRGPSFTVDTACSSSLVALHTACQSLRTGESSMAIAAGVHLNMLPEFWISYSMSRLFGEAGRSFAFDERGTGYGRGEGCGMVLLKLLDDAIRDNDPIRAVITGSGVNQDGKTPGITMPNGSAQETLIRSVYTEGGMDPSETGYVEAHGTGTRVGDPIEVEALHNVFGEDRTKRKPLFIGSVKSNIGHLEAAAGIAGVIKTALMLERGFILPNYDFKRPNEKIPFDEWGMKVATRQQPWPFGKRWASVNGFGFGGTNAHIVMTRGPLDRKTMKEEIDVQSCRRLIIVSANDKASTEKTMQKLGVYLEQRPEVFQNDLLSNLAYTLGQRKSLHPWRIAVSASSSADLVVSLSSGKVIPSKQELDDLRLGWIFTGQGAQWWAMGRELYHQYPTYSAALDKADSHLHLIGAEFSLLEELGKDEETTGVNAAHISQPACTAVQLALVDLLMSWDIRPSAVAGHSSGEIAAAYAAGLISFEDAMTVAYHRGRLIPVLKKRYPNLDGCMMAVGAGKKEIAPLLDLIPQSLGEARIACVNSPSSVTVSGDTDAIIKLQTLIEDAYPGTFARRLQIDTAYHSHHMNLVAKEYTEAVRHLQPPRTSQVLFYSSLLGRLASGIELDASYWVSNLTCAVRFDEAVQGMCRPLGDCKTGVNILVELGPHAALQGPIKQILKHIGGASSKITYSSVLSRKKDAVQTALAMAATLFVKGATLDMGAINFPKPLDRPPQVLTDLPRYSWNHSTSFYQESRLTRIHKHHSAPRNDIIGVLAPYANDFEPTWRNVVRLDDLPWLRHHQMQGVTIFPISGFIAMAIEAMAQKAHEQEVDYHTLEVRDLKVTAPAMLTEDGIEMTITLREGPASQSSDLRHKFTILSWSHANGWTEHCVGMVKACARSINEVDGSHARQQEERKLKCKVDSIAKSASDPIEIQTMYKQLSDIGVSYGATFQGLQHSHASASAATAQIRYRDTVSEMPHHQETKYIVHPVMLEQLITMYWPILAQGGSLDTVHLPSSIGKVSISSKLREYINVSGSVLHGFSELAAPLEKVRPNTLSMFAIGNPEEVMISIEELVVMPILDNPIGDSTESARELCYKLQWERIPDIPSRDKNGASTPRFDTELVIIHGETGDQMLLASMLSDQLTEWSGVTPTKGPLSSMCKFSKDKLCIFITELDKPMLANLHASEFEMLKELLTSVQGLLWVVCSAYESAQVPDANMVTGLSRTLRSEGTLMKIVTLDMDPIKSSDSIGTVSTILDVFRLVFSVGSTVEETEFMDRNGQLQTPRIVNDEVMNQYVNDHVNPPTKDLASFTDLGRPLKGLIETPGAPDSIIFQDDASLVDIIPKDLVDIQVKAVGVDSSDLNSDSVIGRECSGVVIAKGSNVSNVNVGDRVAAITTNGSLSTVARVQHTFVFKIPDHVSYQSGACTPMAFCTAAYAIMCQTSVSGGESILVHDGATPAGFAALSIAQMLGMDVWATVGSEEEKIVLMRELLIKPDRIWYKGSDYFAEHIHDNTEGHGVDIVFNTIGDPDIIRSTWACLAKFGRFINIGSGRCAFGDVPGDKNVTILTFDISTLIEHRPKIVESTLSHIAKLLQYVKIQPIPPAERFSVSQVARALHYVQAQGPHNKAVIVPNDNDSVLAPHIGKHRVILRKDATYILIGGTGGLGRSMTKWMISKGATNIVLLSRSGILKGKAKEQISALNDAGANIIVRRCDVASRSSVEDLVLVGLTDLPPVRGIIHGAMVLHDVLFEKMTFEQYDSVIASKVKGAWNFYHALTQAKASLDFFVVISSAAGAVGNRGQAAYAAANTFLNGFAQYLIDRGIHSASIDLTAVSDAGYLAEDAEKAAEVARTLGSDTICETEVLALIQAAVEGELASCNSHPITGMRITPTMRPFWANDAKFLHLLRAAEAATADSSSANTISWSAAFKAASSRGDAEYLVCRALVEKIAEVISMEPEELDTSRALSHYPLDSLTAIEVRNFITRMFEANLQVLELLASGSIESLARIVCTKSKVGVPDN